MTAVHTVTGPARLDPYAQGDLFDPATIIWVHDLSSLPLLVAAIRAAIEIIVDLESTGINEYADGRSPLWPESARIVLASFTLPTAANPDDPNPPTFVIPLSHPEGALQGRWRAVVTGLVEVMAQSGLPITNANLKFDLRWLYAVSGIDLSAQFAWDTQISSHLLDENASTKLKERAPASFGVERWDDFDLATPAAAERVPIFDLGTYAARDTMWTWRLAVLHRTIMGVGREGEDLDPPEDAEEVEQRRLGALAVWCAMPTSATLTRMEQRGLLMDREWVLSTLADYTKEAEEIKAALTPRYTMDLPAEDASFAPTSKWFKEWAARAVDAGDLVVAALTEGGAPQWSKAVLVRQARQGSEVAQALLDYRKAAKRAEFLHSWLDLQATDGAIHTTYHAGRVITGRLSSSDPNVQQITASLKPAFIPRPGYLIADLDLSQIELRIGAFVSGSEPMRQAYFDGLDLHVLIAARTTGKAPEDVLPEERQRGKAGNFGFLFGMGADGFRTYAETNYGVTLTAEEAQESRDAFFDQWEGLASWHNKAILTAQRTGQVVSPIGRVRRLPHIWSNSDYLRSRAERNAINSPVQGLGSDIMQIGAASIAGNLPGHAAVPDVHLVGTVHDSIVAEVPEDDWARATGRMMRRMIEVPATLAKMGCSFDIPLEVEAKIGTRWGLADIGIIK